MNNINFLEIIKKGWKITWSNRYLWWFGLFLALGGGASFNFNFPGESDFNKRISGKEETLNRFFEQYWQIVAALGIILALFAIAVFVFRILSQAGIIKEVNKIEKNDQGSFKRGIAEGKRYFWKLFLLEIIVVILIIAILIILGVPVAFLFFLKSYLFGFLSAFLAIIIFIPLVILVSFSRKYAQFYLVLADLGIRESLEKGYYLFRKNILMSIIMALVFIPISMILLFAMLIILLVAAVVFVPMGFILYFILSKVGIIIAVLFGILAFIICLAILSSVYQVLYQASWYLFFKEIASIKEEEKAVESVEEVVEKTLPDPERA
ncbi:MAG: hypothetical protein V1804_04720 [Patescibacteria group bacterium]